MISALFLHWKQACTWFHTPVFSGKWHGDYSFSLFSVCIKLLEICFHLSLQWSICYSQENFYLFPCTFLRSASAWHFAKLFYLFIFFFYLALDDVWESELYLLVGCFHSSWTLFILSVPFASEHLPAFLHCSLWWLLIVWQLGFQEIQVSLTGKSLVSSV